MTRHPNFLIECKAFYARYLASKFGSPAGASDSEVTQFEQKHQLQFSLAHREFLLWMGIDYSGVLKGSEWFLRDIIDNNIFLRELLEENDVLCDDQRGAICFFSHQGYMAAWYYLDEGCADPECFFYTEAFDEPHPTMAGRFSDFLLKELMGAAEALGSLH